MPFGHKKKKVEPKKAPGKVRSGLVPSEKEMPRGRDIKEGDVIVNKKVIDAPELMVQSSRYIKQPIPICAIQMKEPFDVCIKEELAKGKAGDWLIKGVAGELYPCDQGIFAKTYKPA